MLSHAAIGLCQSFISHVKGRICRPGIDGHRQSCYPAAGRSLVAPAPISLGLAKHRRASDRRRRTPAHPRVIIRWTTLTWDNPRHEIP
jgi:hypothetical protein